VIWRCPICRKPTDSEGDRHFPFCSERCRLGDLGAWASGKYVISEPAFEFEDAEIAAREENENET
jgi:endogenous inhibitor of DNA gyrase (YacG/DUF329 family)